MKTSSLLFEKIIFYGSHLFICIVFALGLITVFELFKFTDKRVMVDFSDVFIAFVLGFFYWYSRIALGKLKYNNRTSRNLDSA